MVSIILRTLPFLIVLIIMFIIAFTRSICALMSFRTISGSILTITNIISSINCSSIVYTYVSYDLNLEPFASKTTTLIIGPHRHWKTDRVFAYIKFRTYCCPLKPLPKWLSTLFQQARRNVSLNYVGDLYFHYYYYMFIKLLSLSAPLISIWVALSLSALRYYIGSVHQTVRTNKLVAHACRL